MFELCILLLFIAFFIVGGGIVLSQSRLKELLVIYEQPLLRKRVVLSYREEIA
jgi:hypothetical protein